MPFTLRRKKPELDLAIGLSDWEWLQDNALNYATAIDALVEKGDEPDDLYRYIQKNLGPDREGLAKRCHNAAKYLTILRDADG